jgi:hypothetical protein
MRGATLQYIKKNLNWLIEFMVKEQSKEPEILYQELEKLQSVQKIKDKFFEYTINHLLKKEKISFAPQKLQNSSSKIPDFLLCGSHQSAIIECKNISDDDIRSHVFSLQL